MLPGRRLIVLARSLSRSDVTTIDNWRTDDTSVEVCCDATTKDMVVVLDSEQWDGIAIFGPHPELECAVSRSLRHGRTAITVLLGGDDGLISSPRLAGPFDQDALDVIPISSHDSVRRFAADPRARLIFRTRWHARALANELGISSFARASVVPPAVNFEQTIHAKPLRVLFPGVVDTARRSGADLFVRTAVELSHRPGFDDLEFLIIRDQVRDERVLKPLENMPLKRVVASEALGTSSIALVTARDGSSLRLAVESAARGILPIVQSHPAFEELLPLYVSAVDDPGALADCTQQLLSQPTRLKELARKTVAAARSSFNSNLARKEELRAFTTNRAARPAKKSTKAPVLTVGIPAWNASMCLERCVASISRCDQSGIVEIIIVNDGSTDNTGVLANRIAADHPGRVRVIHQENRGHGGALNTALKEARGTYFRVVDADDWVDSLAFAKLSLALKSEQADLVLTGYAEDRQNAEGPVPIRILERLPPGALCRFDTILDPIYGLTSWGPILSTSTFRTALLRKARLTLTERSAYVDLEYCTLGLEYVETMRHLPLDLYRYSLGRDGQTVDSVSYQKRFRQHEAVIVRLCEFVRDAPTLSPIKRQYIAERVITPVALAHTHILLDLLQDKREAKSFRSRMKAFSFISLPDERRLRQVVVKTLKGTLPEPFVSRATGARSRSQLALEAIRYVAPSAIARFLVRDR